MGRNFLVMIINYDFILPVPDNYYQVNQNFFTLSNKNKKSIGNGLQEKSSVKYVPQFLEENARGIHY